MAYVAGIVAKTFAEMNPDEKVWATWIDKSEILDKVQEHIDYEDDESEITAEAIVTEDFIEMVFDSINNDDYLWERFNENFSETISELVSEKLKVLKEDKELWDTEKEKRNENKS